MADPGRDARCGLRSGERLQFDRGYVSPYFVTDADKMEAVLEDAAIPPRCYLFAPTSGPVPRLRCAAAS
jgi:hypothetical protein